MRNKLEYTINKEKCPRISWLGLGALSIVAIFWAAFAMAADYSLDYAATGLDGAQSQTTDYEVIGLLTADGVDSEPQSSAAYSVTTTTGLKDEAGTRVDDWMLY